MFVTFVILSSDRHKKSEWKKPVDGPNRFTKFNSQKSNYNNLSPNFEPENRFEAFNENNQNNIKRQVFQKDSQEEAITVVDYVCKSSLLSYSSAQWIPF